MTQRLPHLHDPYDGGVDLVLAVLENALLRRFLLIICLFQLDLNRNLELEVFSDVVIRIYETCVITKQVIIESCCNSVYNPT